MIRHAIFSGLAGSLLVGTGPVLAHHSFAMFDQTRKVDLEVVVKEFQWSNPHSWLQVIVKNEQGGTNEWSLEMLSPSVLGRMGWNRKSLKPGDRVTVVFYPMRDGSRGGNLINVTKANGQAIGGTP
jgi:hypothetical protein